MVARGPVRHVYLQRNDDTNLNYRVETSINLVSGIWETTGSTPVGTNAMGGGIHYDQITNRISLGEASGYIRITVLSEQEG